jgi:hypothetical protein
MMRWRIVKKSLRTLVVFCSRVLWSRVICARRHVGCRDAGSCRNARDLAASKNRNAVNALLGAAAGMQGHSGARI